MKIPQQFHYNQLKLSVLRMFLDSDFEIQEQKNIQVQSNRYRNSYVFYHRMTGGTIFGGIVELGEEHGLVFSAIEYPDGDVVIDDILGTVGFT